MQKKPRPSDLDALYNAILKLVSPLKPVPCQAVGSMIFINPEEIAFITAVPGGLDVVDLNNARWKRFDTLTALAEKFKADPLFLKASRSEIINLRQVRALHMTATGTREVSFKTLPADVRVSIADSSYAAFKKAMGISAKADASLKFEPEGRSRNAKK